MGERNLDFDTVIERRNTKSIKYDFVKEFGKPEDILPLWVADMDFKTSSYITDALESIVSHGIFGYSDCKESYFEAVKGWMKRHHDWEVSKDWLVTTPGVVFALSMAVRAFTKEGESVLIQQPVYYPFARVTLDNSRRLVINELRLTENVEFVKEYLQKNLPKVKMARHEGTYLIWLDFKEYGLSDAELDRIIVEKAGLWFDSGAMFGKSGEGFQRINIACPRAILEQALEKLSRVF